MRSLSLIFSVLFLLAVNPAAGQSVRETSSDFSKGISVYPNPAVDEYVYVKMEDLDARKVKLTLYNIIGNEMHIETEVVDQHEIRMRIKELASGYYLLALRDEGTKFKGTYKFLKR